jgi:hypothetical protein
VVKAGKRRRPYSGSTKTFSMFLDKQYILPDWKERYNDEEEEDNGATKAAGRTLYEQWREVYRLVMTFAAVLADDPESDTPATEAQWTKRLIHENAMIVAPKIISASHSTLYILQMENAALIRFNCRQLMEQVSYAALTGQTEEAYVVVIEEAMEQFRLLFSDWVTTFQRDEYEDEWGLFL